MKKVEKRIASPNISIHVKYALFIDHDNKWYEVKVKSEYAFWVIQSGTMTIEYDKKTFHLSAGDVFFFYPQILYHATSKEGCSFAFIHFDAVHGHSCEALHFFPFDGHYTSEVLNGKQNQIIESTHIVKEKEAFHELEIQGATMCLLSYIMRLKHQENTEEFSASRKSDMARLQTVLIYVSNHLAETICINELAELVNMSEKYFITFFKKAMGITPRQYIIQIKMKKALEYLHEQKFSVKEVATLVGYPDIYSFSKAFKKIYGIAPTKF